jgi:two-component system alkaline phosphatase synthesis response regulator PhoP
MIVNKTRIIFVLSDVRELSLKFEADVASLGYNSASKPFSRMEISEIRRLTPVAVILILSEWDDDKLDACELLLEKRALPEDIPVIALIAENVMRKVSREFLFADIIVLPYTLPELDFRLERVIYQYQKKASRDITIDENMSIDLSSCEVKINHKPITLTFKEYELLKYLIVNRGHVFKRDSLLDAIWGRDYYGGTRTVDVHIRRIRYKIGDIDETYIKTIRGVGYTFRTTR